MIFAGFQKLDLLNYPAKVAATVFTYGCNFRCPYCHNPSLVVPGEKNQDVDESEVLSYLKMRQNMLEGLVVTGGEPTLHEGLENFIKKVRDLGLCIKIDTNGTNPAMVERLVSSDLVSYIALDFKTSFENYGKVLSPEGSTEKIQKTLDILRNSFVMWEIRTTCAPEIVTEEDLDRIKEYMDSLKCTYRWFLQPFNPAVTLDEAFGEKKGSDVEFLMKKADEFKSEFCLVSVR